MMTLLAGALLLAVPLAGCVGTDWGEAGPTSAAEAPGVGTLAFDQPTVDRTLWANGTFTAQQTTTGLVGATNEDLRLVSLGELPAEVPVRIVAELSYSEPTASPVGANDLDTFVASGDLYERDPVYREEIQDEPGRERNVATFADFPDEPVQFAVLAQGLQEGQERDYTLRIDLESVPGVVPARVPVAVEASADADRIEITSTASDVPVTAAAWDPDDTFLGRHAPNEGPTEIPVEGAGEHVILTADPAHLRVHDADGDPVTPEPAIRALNTTLVDGDRHALPPEGGPETWGFETDRVPLTPTARILPGEDPASVMFVNGITIEVRTEAGPIFQQNTNCPACIFTGDIVTGGPIGHANVQGTSFEITAEYNASTNAEVVPGWLTYKR